MFVGAVTNSYYRPTYLSWQGSLGLDQVLSNAVTGRVERRVGGCPAIRTQQSEIGYARALPYSTSRRLHAFSACGSLYTRESGGHQPCIAGYTSISADSPALSKVSFITVFSVGACISSFSAMATKNCALVVAA